MMKEKKLILYPFIGLAIGQIESKELTSHDDISEVWQKTVASFNASDLQVIYPGLPTSVKDSSKTEKFNRYLKEFSKLFSDICDSNCSVQLYLRFTERIRVASVVTDKGVFKTVINGGTKDERTFFGNFSGLLQKEDDVWRITLDYDFITEDLLAEMSFNTAQVMASQEMSLPC